MECHPEYALRPDLVLLPLDDEVVAFSETAQSLIGLNAGAAAIVKALKAGKRASEIVNHLASEGAEGPTQAQEWLDAVLAVLRSGGFMLDTPPPSRQSGALTDDDKPVALPVDMPPHGPFNATVERRYRLLDTCALIRFRHGAQARVVNTIIGHLATDDDTAPTIVIDVAATMIGRHIQSYIYLDGKPSGYSSRISGVGPIIKSFLWRSALDAHPFLFDIHAGVVGAGNACVLLPAAPGSGKSSLTAALTASGFRYFSDEVALVDTPEFDVLPVPLAFCAKRSGWDVMGRYFPAILQAQMHRRADGKDVRYVAPPPHLVQLTPARVTHIIFPQYKADAQTRLVRVGRSDALRRLMDECLALKTHLNLQHIRRLIETMCRIDCYTLTFSSLDEAVELVSDAVGVRNAVAVNYA